jgi:hypothetical protein
LRTVWTLAGQHWMMKITLKHQKGRKAFSYRPAWGIGVILMALDSSLRAEWACWKWPGLVWFSFATIPNT